RSRQSVIFRLQRLELMEQWIDDERLQEKQNQTNRQRDEPEIEPPSLRALANHHKQQVEKNDRQNRADDFALGPIPEPRAPTLYRNSILSQNPVAINSKGQLENIHRNEKQRRKNRRLHELTLERPFRHIAVFGRPL